MTTIVRRFDLSRATVPCAVCGQCVTYLYLMADKSVVTRHVHAQHTCRVLADGWVTDRWEVVSDVPVE